MELFPFDVGVRELVEKDKRYPAAAYYFIRDGLDHTVRQQRRGARGVQRHVSGQELSQGLAAFALAEFGPMARFTLATWGLHTTEDFGEVVYNLIEIGLFSQSKNDRKEDFNGSCNLEEALTKPYRV